MINLDKIPEKYRKNIVVIGRECGNNTMVKYTHDKCGCILETQLKVLYRKKNFDFCKSHVSKNTCQKHKKDINIYINLLPIQYRDKISILTENGAKSKIEFIHGCGCKTVGKISTFIERKQLDLCKKCFDLKRNKSRIVNYFERIPNEIRDRVELVSESQSRSRLGCFQKVLFKYGCGCKRQINIGKVPKIKNYDLCPVCSRHRTSEYYISKLHIKDMVHDIVKEDGFNSIINMKYSCGCSENVTIKNLYQRKSIICKNCLHINSHTKEDMINELSEYLTDVSIISGFPGNRSTILNGNCLKCKQKYEDTFFNIQQFYHRNKTGCKKCHSVSYVQQELFDFIKSICPEATQNNRNIINVNGSLQEIDILCKSKNFGIEFNGLYFHSEKYKNDKFYHNKKTLACRNIGISLFHIWEDKWETKKDIVKSMIRYRLGVINNKIHARKTIIKELSKNESKEFFDKNHLDGNVGNIKSFGLIIEGKIIQAISVRKPNNKSKKYINYIEIARMATVINTVVVGGESKLLSYVEKWARQNLYAGILTYVNSDLGSSPCKKWKFDYRGETGISYFYIKHNVPERISRQKVRAKNGKSEKEIADSLNLLKVNANTNMIYVYDFKNNKDLKDKFSHTILVEETDDGAEAKLV